MFTDGIKSREFWVVLVATAIIALYPDFPKENFIAIGTWVVGRASQKAFGFVDSAGNNKWLSTEFILSIVGTLLVAIFPDIPTEALFGVAGWAVVRSGVKVGTAIKENKDI